jgi:DNA-binding XRE family transcriptional regulator
MVAQRRISERERLRKEAARLLRLVERMTAAFPLAPIWPGLAAAKADHTIGDPPAPTAEDKEIDALRGPLSEFLKDADRFVNDHGTTTQRERFRGNALVHVAFYGRHHERRRYPKADCVADLRSLGRLFGEVGKSETSGRTAKQARRGSLSERFRAAREAAGHTQEQAAAEIGIDAKALSQYERGVRTPRRNRDLLKTYISRHPR